MAIHFLASAGKHVSQVVDGAGVLPLVSELRTVREAMHIHLMYTVHIQIFAGRYFHEFCQSMKVREIKITKILTISQGDMHVRKALNR